MGHASQCNQARPACSRCTRLGIPCIGSGQQRFKFKDESKVLRENHGQQLSQRKPATSKPKSGSSLSFRTGPVLGAPSWPLSNGLTRTNGAIISVLEISDPRYDVFAFGPFIKDIPAQLGTHDALDASTEALTSAIYCVQTRRVTPESLTKYARALKQVQHTLNGSATVYSEQTLCAIYFIMLCQAWITNENHSFTGHGQAMAHLLNVIVSKNLHNSLNAGMLITMSISVLLESILNPTIRLRPWFFKLAEMHRPPAPVHSLDGVALTSLDLHQLILMRDIIRNPSQHVEQMQTLYRLIKLELPSLQRHISENVRPACAAPTDTLPVFLLRVQTRYFAAYSVLLSMALAINGYLRAIDPCKHSLAKDLDMFYSEAVSHAEEMKDRRPLGASHIPLLLISASVAVNDDPPRETALGAMLYQYESDLTDLSWISKSGLARRAYKRQCEKLARSVVKRHSSEPEVADKAADHISAISINTEVECEPDDACNFL
ncbi:hypothetical protein HIM_04300 [Hirsutella minnesotensis 3608]|uniref:Zn(2)-C6 fungal-type domain-containing protein n=1 Tax=Hirsutella minnesotensis 3608 TaxID=1043627 RepID=A0A0F7ZV94_9HYPO|nr:hypothetical protein HIM_04300 [Hirsutella minnesotensis 3608]